MVNVPTLFLTKSWVVAYVTSTHSLVTLARGRMPSHRWDSCTMGSLILDAGLFISKEDSDLASPLGCQLVVGKFLEPCKGSWNLTVRSLVDVAALARRATSVVPVRRDILACFSSVYVFIRESHDRRQPFWRSVIKELRWLWALPTAIVDIGRHGSTCCLSVWPWCLREKVSRRNCRFRSHEA